MRWMFADHVRLVAMGGSCAGVRLVSVWSHETGDVVQCAMGPSVTVEDDVAQLLQIIDHAGRRITGERP